MDWIKRKTGVHPNTKCFICGITAAESFKKGPIETGMNHPEYCQTYSFYGYGSKQDKNLCPRCHKEKQLRDLFAVMDARDGKRKELTSNNK